jgi:uncharacterized phage protein (TIGR01671 family)
MNRFAPINRFNFRAWDRGLKKYVPFVPVLLASIYDDKIHDFEQSTGWQDNAGTEIFEGDIVRIEHNWKEKVGVVEWDHLLAGYEINKTRMYQASPIILSNCSKAFVIGNIRQNPELVA